MSNQQSQIQQQQQQQQQLLSAQQQQQQQNSQQNQNNDQLLKVDQYNWLGVIEFIQEQYKSLQIKETEWLLQKQQMQEKIHQQESMLKAQENINLDLIKRIKMLEFSLRQERIRYSKLLQGDHNMEDIIHQNLINAQITSKISGIQRKAVDQKPFLKKILDEIGMNELEELELMKENNKNSTNTNQLLDSQQNDAINLKDQEKTLVQEQTSNAIQQKESQSYNTTKQQELQQTSIQESNYKLELKCQLMSHLDVVRDIVYCNNNILMSVSEDCMVKLWDVSQFENYSESLNIDPYITLREHTGPLFTATCRPKQISESSTVAFTAGSGGIIKCWNLPQPKDIDTYGPSENKNFCIGTWNCHGEEAIWQLAHHPYQRKLLSSSSDGTIKLLTYNEEYEQNEFIKECIKFESQTYIFQQNNLLYIDIPTSVTWINTNLSWLASGYVVSPSLVIFDVETSKIVQQQLYSNDLQKQNQQINKLVSHSYVDLLISGHDNKLLKFYDLKTNKFIKSFEAHSDSISGLAVDDQYNLYSVSHDGILKVWDIRNYKCLSQIENCHQQKFDENIQTVVVQQPSKYITTAGSDGVIKIFTLA